MRRGISFVSDSSSDQVLKKVFSNIECEDNDWIIDDVSNAFDPGLLKGKFAGNMFKKTIQEQDDYQFVRIRRYPLGEIIDKIDSYEDFLASSCTLILLCVDGGFYDIYSKNQRELEIISDICNDLDITVETITDDTDARYHLHAR